MAWAIRIMTDIKNSLEKIRAASKMLQENDFSADSDEEKIQNLRDTLSEINDGIEKLKEGVSQTENSPIRFNK